MCIMGGLCTQPVLIASYNSKLGKQSVVEELRLYSQTWCEEPFSTRNTCLVLSLILASKRPSAEASQELGS